MKYTSQHWCDKTMDDKMALNREHWDNSSMSKDLLELVLIGWFPNCKNIMVNKVTYMGFRGQSSLPESNPEFKWMTMSILFLWRWELVIVTYNMCVEHNTWTHFADYTRPVRYSINR